MLTIGITKQELALIIAALEYAEDSWHCGDDSQLTKDAIECRRIAELLETISG